MARKILVVFDSHARKIVVVFDSHARKILVIVKILRTNLIIMRSFLF